jgi:pyruvate,water dikinase
MAYTLSLEEIDKGHLSQVGGKNASLGELLRAGVRVPPGFAVTTEAYREFMRKSGIEAEILGICGSLDADDVASIEQASRRIKDLFIGAPIPTEIEDEIREAYVHLGVRAGVRDVPVAVRSSATAEDMPQASFAGQQDTYLWVEGSDEVLRRTKECWASLFTPRAICYRTKMKFPHERVLMSVGVQKMVMARAAGVLFTLDPVNGDPSRIVIEANFGFGETVVSGSVTPDRFVIDKVLLEIAERTISPKLIECVPDPRGGVVHRDVPQERQGVPCLEDKEIVELAKLARRIEEHYGSAQDIEWAIDQDLAFPENVFILQSRPETVWAERQKAPLLGKKSGYELFYERAMKVVRM